ncbi:unnamed protein product [Musa acuminata subsp. malaccensis]|uniref:(wild Malaysian banana) hypothetical protein n=1 Tax=Musa acuminata subsp. malaccensis TaxID=214687 RepID=A0A8D7F9S5_MUSAM|nr:unnamed protein product [Musa acuminata subsp. malaccensis]
MNSQQGRPSANGYNHRRVDTVTGSRMDSKMQSRKSAFPSFGNACSSNGIKAGRVTSPSRDRLTYVLTCLVGHRVEVHVKNGSIISGIFHATNADKDFEIVLKMAQVVNDGSVREQKSVHDTIKTPQPMIIPARELVQVLAKDVSLSSDEFTSGHAREKRKDLMIDSVISHSHHMEMERQLAPWMPDEDDPDCPELDNIFDGTLDRNWDQFETNETLFGVKSTFNEELYTTKLERGPQMKELERAASRIAREIEGEETHDFHLAEERGFYSHDDFGLDEESKYSAVRREANDSGFREKKKSVSDISNLLTGYLIDYMVAISCLIHNGQSSNKETNLVISDFSFEMDLHFLADKDLGLSSVNHNTELMSNSISWSSPSLDVDIRLDANQIKDQVGKECMFDLCLLINILHVADKHLSTESEGLSLSATLSDPSSCNQGNIITEPSDSPVLGKLPAASKPIDPPIRLGGSAEHACADSALSHPCLSPSSSCGSLSSDKSTLNPNAKEFKLNPNAKSFTPLSSMRLHTAVSDGSIYYPSNATAVPHMHGLPIGVGVGPSFGHQPVLYNPQAAPMQSSQAYVHPSGPMYGQQMIVGQPPQFYYVQSYPPEMPQKGRKF